MSGGLGRPGGFLIQDYYDNKEFSAIRCTCTQCKKSREKENMVSDVEKRETFNALVRNAIIAAAQKELHNQDFIEEFEYFMQDEGNYYDSVEDMVDDWIGYVDVLESVHEVMWDAVVDTFAQHVKVNRPLTITL